MYCNHGNYYYFFIAFIIIVRDDLKTRIASRYNSHRHEVEYQLYDNPTFSVGGVEENQEAGAAGDPVNMMVGGAMVNPT